MEVLSMVDKRLIEEIKNNTNIVEIIGEVISLQKSGRNFLGLCPFHGEKTPSFNVVEDKQFYHCFGCGRSGDVFKFIEEYQQVTFADAVRILAERLGIQMAAPVQGSVQPRSPHQNLYDMHEKAARFYHAILMTTKMGEEARNYLYKRGLTDDVLKHFMIGLAPAERSYLYQRLADDYSEKDLLDSGLFYLSESNQFFDTFHNRIMFPLSNDQGKVIAFSGRVWQETDSQTGKYKNSRATAIFNKSYELYHLERVKKGSGKAPEIYLMEGFMDVIAAYRAGIENAVASMGTALTSEHVEHLKRFTKKVIVTYDGDKAGQAATAKALDELKDIPVQVVQIPDAMDPDEYLQKNSPQDLAYLLTNTRISPVEFYIHHFRPENSENLQAQIEFIEKIAPLFAFLQKTLELMEEGLDYQVLTNIFEIQILTRFGISLNFNECVFCHRVGQAFDFSFKYGACLCPEHYHEDEKRCHLNPNIPYLLNQFQAINFETLETISLKSEIKQELRKFMDQIYEEYVGIHLKSKKFIDSLADWGQLLKEENK